MDKTIIIMIGLYWGRFNPPHKGHLRLIRKILKEVDNLIIVIGSAELKNTKRNPFSGIERKKMLAAYLKEEKIGTRKIKIIVVPDKKSFSAGINNLFRSCSNFDILYTDKKTIINLIKNRVKVKKIKRTGSISSTQVREAIANGKKWEHLTGKSVVGLVKKFKGIERIYKAYYGINTSKYK